MYSSSSKKKKKKGKKGIEIEMGYIKNTVDKLFCFETENKHVD
jgi:hypothetical protein